MRRFAVFYITPPGESDSEGLYIAQSKKHAVEKFVRDCGEDDFDWEAHRLSAWKSRTWCNGYLAALCDAEDRAESLAAFNRQREEALAANAKSRKKGPR